MSCHPHRVTSSQSKSVINKWTLQNFSYGSPFSSQIYQMNLYVNIKQNVQHLEELVLSKLLLKNIDIAHGYDILVTLTILSDVSVLDYRKKGSKKKKKTA